MSIQSHVPPPPPIRIWRVQQWILTSCFSQQIAISAYLLSLQVYLNVNVGRNTPKMGLLVHVCMYVRTHASTKRSESNWLYMNKMQLVPNNSNFISTACRNLVYYRRTDQQSSASWGAFFETCRTSQDFYKQQQVAQHHGNRFAYLFGM